MRVYKVWYMICWTHHHVLPDDALTHSLEAPHIYKRALFSLGDREQCPFHKVVYQAFVGFQSNWTFTVSTEALRRPGEAAGRCLFQVQLGNLQPRDRRRLSEAPGGEGRSGLAVLNTSQPCSTAPSLTWGRASSPPRGRWEKRWAASPPSLCLVTSVVLTATPWTVALTLGLQRWRTMSWSARTGHWCCRCRWHQVAPSQTLGSQGTGPGSALDPRSAGGPHKVCGSLCSNEMAMAAKITVCVCVSHLSGTRAKQCVTWTSVHNCMMRDKTHRQEHNTLWLYWTVYSVGTYRMGKSSLWWNNTRTVVVS